ncbi:arginine:pyruvate transaminase [Albimonas donghaensis]|uniref:Aminotransferase n=1 Tax=Albimonas donghaensis TaxID=356660 RepID=A0A1H2SA90_9RHOB|nr:pyridoxal phosphate-dependent aminotransferase [Albimonas donghaensis]SDW28378.1 arginine:pyruvate transaminase [Albimonas donghaensis]
MHPSRRIRSILDGGASGWEIVYAARDLQAKGERVTMLTIGEHENPTPAPILDAMDASARAGRTGYSSVMGSLGLREAIAARASRRAGAPVAPDEVVVAAGGQAALFQALCAVIDPGDAVVAIDPLYTTYPGTIRAAGGIPRIVPARAEDGFQPDLAALDIACAGARALLVNSPNNPTGAVYSAASIEGLAELARRHDLWLISDEVYDGMAWDQPHLSPRALPGMAERTVIIGSLSKSHAMTGSRIGWAAAPAEIAALIVDLALNANYGLPRFIQDAGEWALREGDAIEDDLRAAFRARRDLARAALSQRPGLRLSPPQGGMYVMPDIRATGLDARTFAERLLEEERIAVMPGESFGDAASGHVRIALTVTEPELADALDRLAGFADRLAAAR